MTIHNLLERYKTIKTPQFDLGSARMNPLKIATRIFHNFPQLDNNHVVFRSRIDDMNVIAGTLSIEQEVVEWGKRLLGFDNTFGGEMVTGSTEGIITSLWHAREFHKKHLGIKPMVLMSELTHHAFVKGCEILELSYRKISVDSAFQINTTELHKEIESLSKTPLIIILTLGYTTTGTYDSLDCVQRLVNKMRGHVNGSPLIIIDGAIGGLTIPFLCPEWRLPSSENIFSFVTDFHKYGFCHYGSGLLLYNNFFYGHTGVPVPYAPNRIESSLCASRSALPALSTRAVIEYLGKDKWKSKLQKCMRLRSKMVNIFKEFPTIKIISEPNGIPCLTVDFGLSPQRSKIIEKEFRIVPFKFQTRLMNEAYCCHRIYINNGVDQRCLSLFKKTLHEAFR